MMLSCKDVTQLISESMDRSLPLGKRIGVRIHLLMCLFCARYERQLLLIRETTRGHGGNARWAVPRGPFGGRAGAHQAISAQPVDSPCRIHPATLRVRFP